MANPVAIKTDSDIQARLIQEFSSHLTSEEGAASTVTVSLESTQIAEFDGDGQKNDFTGTANLIVAEKKGSQTRYYFKRCAYFVKDNGELALKELISSPAKIRCKSEIGIGKGSHTRCKEEKKPEVTLSSSPLSFELSSFERVRGHAKYTNPHVGFRYAPATYQDALKFADAEKQKAAVKVEVVDLDGKPGDEVKFSFDGKPFGIIDSAALFARPPSP